MTTKHLIYLALLLVAGMCPVASAQEPSPAPSPRNAPTFVYLKPDYVEALKPSGLVHDNPVTAVFVRFDNDFAVFKRPESNALVYVPKSAVLYISAKPDPAFSIKY